MNTMTRVAALAAFTVALGAAPAASAAVTVKTIFTGFVADGGNDPTLFGAAGDDLAGLAFTATFWSTLTKTNTDLNSPFGYVAAYGGYYASHPVLAVGVLKINGQTYTMDGARFSRLRQDAGDAVEVLVAHDQGVVFEHLSMTAAGDFLDGLNLTQTYSYAPGGQIGTGELAFMTNNLQFKVYSVNGGMIPEPATWALMLGGFGLTGAALRRRRLVVA